MNLRANDIERRCRRLKNGRRGKGPVVYWLSRDQRVRDNWALLFAQQEALIHKRGIVVVFCLVPDFLGATSQHYAFLLQGLDIVSKELNSLNIDFIMFKDSPQTILPAFLRQIDAHLLVADFDPLRIKKQWKTELLGKVATPIYEIDTHNIIPAWLVSDKKEYGAYTIRPKIHRLLDDFLTDIPTAQPHPVRYTLPTDIPLHNHPSAATNHLPLADVQYSPGERVAWKKAKRFLATGLQNYAGQLNNPCLQGQSGLSPYLHFGHLSAQRLAYEILQCPLPAETTAPFLEQLIVRRELSDNFCLYENNYDSFEGFPNWAQETLNQHRKDTREYIYSLDELEAAQSHDPLWNAAQSDLVRSAKLHGYLRMYWAKKILEWTPSPEAAMQYAITLNDRYSLDGRDPNGYAGIAWSIGGVHDRAWKERPVFGKIRYMNAAGCRRKFNTARYIAIVSVGKKSP